MRMCGLREDVIIKLIQISSDKIKGKDIPVSTIKVVLSGMDNLAFNLLTEEAYNKLEKENE